MKSKKRRELEAQIEDLECELSDLRDELELLEISGGESAEFREFLLTHIESGLSCPRCDAAFRIQDYTTSHYPEDRALTCLECGFRISGDGEIEEFCEAQEFRNVMKNIQKEN